MPDSEFDRLRAKVRALPEAERAELAQELVATLDGEPEPDAASEWDQELMRRLAEITEGTVETIDRNALTERLRRHD